MVIQHLIALFLIVIAPIWDHFATERLKASKESRLKIAYYRTMVIVGWLTSVIALVAVGWRAILTFNRDSANVVVAAATLGLSHLCGGSTGGAAFHHRSFSPASPTQRSHPGKNGKSLSPV